MAEGVGLLRTSLSSAPTGLALRAAKSLPAILSNQPIDTFVGSNGYFRKMSEMKPRALLKMAEGVGFEPTNGFPLPVFKTARRSRVSPSTTRQEFGGEGEIRTHEKLTPLAVFKTAALDRSATSPYETNCKVCGRSNDGHAAHIGVQC